MAAVVFKSQFIPEQCRLTWSRWATERPNVIMLRRSQMFSKARDFRPQMTEKLEKKREAVGIAGAAAGWVLQPRVNRSN
jgi:hypothetical protein